ncbi:MAG: glycosyltransferase family 2 protein [Lachnospiraceae bacterium]|nr:glycosyltransferase family 2 protein [Lachnospiraceae bacterium]
MKTTVIIPNYNGIDYLKDCLLSLSESESDGFETIVVDDGSKDGSAEYVRTSHPDVKLIALAENTGFAAAVNRGIEAATTKYVLLLNNDTKVIGDFVRRMEQAIEADEKIFSVSAKMLKLSDESTVDGAGDYYCALGWAYAYGKDKPEEKVDKKRQIFSACGGAAIYRRDAVTELGLFDEMHFAYLEDVDLGYRARIAGYINMYEPSAKVLHAGSGFSGSRYNEFKVGLSSKNSTYIIRKNMPFLQRIINLPFFIIGFGIKFLFFCLKGFGIVYLKGLFKGIADSLTAEGRAKKVPFKFANFGNYVKIQVELWINILRRFA